MVLFARDALLKSHAGMRNCIFLMVQHILYIQPNLKLEITCLYPKILIPLAT